MVTLRFSRNMTPTVDRSPRTERLFVGALRVFSVLSVLCVVAFLVTLLRARHELSLTESVVAAQATMLAHDGTLYYSLQHYPYTVCAYMPIFYFLEAGAARIGFPAFLAGRLISISALLASFALCWRLVRLYTGNRYAAWLAALLASSSLPLLSWGTIGVVDMLAVTLSLAAFYQFSRFYLHGENTLLWAGLFAAAAFFTKQTMLAASAAMFVLLLSRNRRKALIFGAALGGFIAVLALGINALLHGHFFANTVFANINPFDIAKLRQHLQYLAVVSGTLLAPLAVSLPRLARSRSAPLLVYFALATVLFLTLASKIGSDSNYQLEPTLLLIVCTCAGLVELNFFELCFRNSKSWITLLQIPIVLFLVMNYRIIAPEIVTRFWRENQFRAEMAAVQPYLRNASGRIFSADLDPLVRSRGKIDIEPVIYGILVRAGRIDPEPVRQDLARQAFPLVILYEDADHPIPDASLEISRLPPAQLAELRRQYHLVEHIDGPYLGGIYLYQPNRP
jgi:hypothetical protein